MPFSDLIKLGKNQSKISNWTILFFWGKQDFKFKKERILDVKYWDPSPQMDFEILIDSNNWVNFS